jgi:hypothetical protein
VALNNFEQANISVLITVVKLFMLQLVMFGQWQISPVLLLIIYWIAYKKAFSQAITRESIKLILTMLLMNAAYIIVFFLCQGSAAFQISVDLHRLEMQLWPSLLFLMFLNCKTPEEILSLKTGSASLETE